MHRLEELARIGCSDFGRHVELRGDRAGDCVVIAASVDLRPNERAGRIQTDRVAGSEVDDDRFTVDDLPRDVRSDLRSHTATAQLVGNWVQMALRPATFAQATARVLRTSSISCQEIAGFSYARLRDGCGVESLDSGNVSLPAA
jgi:hypothetical protein